MNSFFKTTRSTAISSKESFRSRELFKDQSDKNDNDNGVSELVSNTD